MNVIGSTECTLRSNRKHTEARMRMEGEDGGRGGGGGERRRHQEEAHLRLAAPLGAPQALIPAGPHAASGPTLP